MDVPVSLGLMWWVNWDPHPVVHSDNSEGVWRKWMRRLVGAWRGVAGAVWGADINPLFMINQCIISLKDFCWLCANKSQRSQINQLALTDAPLLPCQTTTPIPVTEQSVRYHNGFTKLLQSKSIIFFLLSCLLVPIAATSYPFVRVWPVEDLCVFVTFAATVSVRVVSEERLLVKWGLSESVVVFVWKVQFVCYTVKLLSREMNSQSFHIWPSNPNGHPNQSLLSETALSPSWRVLRMDVFFSDNKKPAFFLRSVKNGMDTIVFKEIGLIKINTRFEWSNLSILRYTVTHR